MPLEILWKQFYFGLFHICSMLSLRQSLSRSLSRRAFSAVSGANVTQVDDLKLVPTKGPLGTYNYQGLYSSRRRGVDAVV